MTGKTCLAANDEQDAHFDSSNSSSGGNFYVASQFNWLQGWAGSFWMVDIGIARSTDLQGFEGNEKLLQDDVGKAKLKRGHVFRAGLYRGQ